ncbi:MAG: hydroxyacid dehydrogenase [Gammaproteobacteria bacterium]|nr:hydroxyacid dehydrogenase [Woeseia sp.]MBT8101849.1 hydroxyacid dehydrogenase [Gammaproteobacteria bacterium]MBU2676463.1 hydroxyacid dehydrogenase [Gammaproteobacteria bacterium]NNL50198.1 hydroxyacid dehydrogenase [Woeseiaceae bacterium]
MAEIVICEFMDEAIAMDVLKEFDVLYDSSLVDDRPALLASLAEARAIIVRNRTQVDAELLDHAPRVEAVGRLGVGLDNIDLDLCKARNVTVYPATGANDLAVAEYAISAALLLLRGVWQASSEVIAGKWPRATSMGREASGKRFGLIGFGSIARQVASRAKALGMHVCAYDPYLPQEQSAGSGIEFVSFRGIAETCDVVSTHVPLTSETHNLIDVEFIRSMRARAILINTARGGVVDESAVIEALREGRLGGAALDVFESEPLDDESGAAFAGVPNLLLTPHIAGITEEANQRVSLVTAENVRRHLV